MNKQIIIRLMGREIQVTFSKAAYKENLTLQENVHLIMELRYSCMIKKSVFQIKQFDDINSVKLSPYISLTFSAITTNVCAPKNINIHGHESIEIINIEKPERFIPDWLSIDYKNSVWLGMFGYKRKSLPR